MKLTVEEKRVIVERRQASVSKAAQLKAARRTISGLVDGMSDKMLVLFAKQIRDEQRRITGNPGRCTCDSQWTNPKCPRVLAGWGGFDCNEPPSPVMQLLVDITNEDGAKS